MKRLLTLITLATLTAPAHLSAMEAGEPETNPTSMEIEQAEQGTNGFPLLPLPVLETELFSYLSIRDQVSLLIACMSRKVEREYFKENLEKVKKAYELGQVLLNSMRCSAVDQPKLTAQIFDQLISQHASLDSKNRNGETALILAVKSKNPAMVKRLIQAKANPNLTTKSGETALSLAETYHQRLTQLLIAKQTDARPIWDLEMGSSLSLWTTSNNCCYRIKQQLKNLSEIISLLSSVTKKPAASSSPA